MSDWWDRALAAARDPESSVVSLLRWREAARKRSDADGERRRATDQALREALAGALVDGAGLVVRPIEATDPPRLLDQVVAGEKVHAIDGPADLARRVGPGRRIFALEHVDSPDELWVFVEIAFTKGLAGDMDVLLHGPTDVEAEADSAIFYSINTCRPGLGGLGLASVLLKRILPILAVERPTLGVFSTLSPMPGFRTWLTGRIDELTPPAIVLTRRLAGSSEVPAARSPDEPAGPDDPDAVGQLVGLAARYLTTNGSNGRVRDPVGNFHLGNGARVERVCWRADLSDSGRRRSLGVMVNYRYEPAHLDERAERYRQGEVVMSRPVEQMAGH